MTTNGRPRLRIATLAAALALTLGLAFKPLAQNGGPPPSYKFTLKAGEQKTDLKVTMAPGRITAVSGMRAGRTFRFKRLKAGEQPKLTGTSGQTLKCGKLKPGDGLQWTMCLYVNSGSGGTEIVLDPVSMSFSKIGSGDPHIPPGAGGSGGGDPSGGGGGGGGTPPNCWEDEKLQMSICDP